MSFKASFDPMPWSVAFRMLGLALAHFDDNKLIMEKVGTPSGDRFYLVHPNVRMAQSIKVWVQNQLSGVLAEPVPCLPEGFACNDWDGLS